MGKPVHERPGYESREDFEQALSDFFKGYLDHEAIIEALRIAAEQVGEREKVVAWHRKRAAAASMNFDDRTAVFHSMSSDAIEAGEHAK